MLYKNTKISLAVIYHGSPEKYRMMLVARPKIYLKRLQKTSSKILALGYSYKFEDAKEGFLILKDAERLLGGKTEDGWYYGPVSRACWAVDSAIAHEQGLRREQQARGQVIGRLRVQRVHAILNEME